MKVAIVGAGFVGLPIITEALARGHEVIVLVRSPEKLQPHDRMRAIKVDVRDVATLAEGMRGCDAVIHAWSPGRGTIAPDMFDQFVSGHRAIIAAAKQAGVRRFLAVGGAASLKVASGVEFLDSEQFPKEFEPFRDAVRGTREQYYLLKAEPALDWVFLAPSVMLTPGPRTGSYRTGKDHVLYDAAGMSHISAEDYAKAMIDELETPRHHRERFTVGY